MADRARVEKIDGLIVDLDGVVWVGETSVPGAIGRCSGWLPQASASSISRTTRRAPQPTTLPGLLGSALR